MDDSAIVCDDVIDADVKLRPKDDDGTETIPSNFNKKKRTHFKVRMCEHLGISALTGKRVKDDDDSAIKEHLLFCNHTPEFEDFSILASNNNDFKVTLMESHRLYLIYMRVIDYILLILTLYHVI